MNEESISNKKFTLDQARQDLLPTKQPRNGKIDYKKTVIPEEKSH